MYSRAVRLVREAVVAGMGTADEKELAGGEERRFALLLEREKNCRGRESG